MRTTIIILLFIIFISESLAQSRRYVLHDLNIVDVVNGTIKSHQVIIIEGDRIKDIVPLKDYHKSGEDSIISLPGKYIIPGLWDMHTHVWYADYFFPLFLANGVTGFRDMFGTVDQLQGWRKSVQSGDKRIPDLFFSGPIVDGPKPVWPGSVAVSNAADGRRAVDSIKLKLKTDFVKVYSLLSRESYFAIAEECKKMKIDFAGHVPNVVTALEAAKSGQKSQEHLYGILEVASDSADLYFKIVQGLASGTPGRSLGVDTILLERLERRKMLLRTFNDQKLNAIAKEISATKTWICPTLVVNYNIGHLDDSLLAVDSRMKYVTSFLKGFWNPKQDMRFRSQTKEYFEITRMEFEKKLLMIPALHHAGVGLLAGTDTPNPYCFPGFSLHDELAWMVKAGLTPAEALQTATINPAIYFSIEKDFGAVEKNKMASLVILDKNPLIDIGNTTSINTVILRGSIMDRHQLDKMLQRVLAMSAQ
jgi:hypothetical protein